MQVQGNLVSVVTIQTQLILDLVGRARRWVLEMHHGNTLGFCSG